MKQKLWFLLVCAVFCILTVFYACGGSDSLSQQSPTPTVSISASPLVVEQGESTTITWNSTGADSVSITGIPDASSPSGVLVVTPEKTTTYTVMTVASGGTQVTAEVTVTVINLTVPPPVPPPPPQVYSVGITATWTLPVLYSDGTPITPDNVALIVVELFMNTIPVFDNAMIPVAVSLPGATSVSFGPIDVTQGVTYYYATKSVLDGRKSVFSPIVPKIWQ